MSFGADPDSPPAGRICSTCAAGSGGGDDDAHHAFRARVLCLECYRRRHPRSSAQSLPERLSGVPLPLDAPQPAFLRPMGGSGLSSNRIAHRRRMLAHLAQARGILRRAR